MAALRHLRLPSYPDALLSKYPSYAYASRVQTALQKELLAWKAKPSSSRGPPPQPTLISFTPTPTYTLGRRQTEPLSEDEARHLRSPLILATPGSRRADSNNGNEAREEDEGQARRAFYHPAITHAPRGGLTTYHGPGQLVLWPVIDLHSPLHEHLSVRDYACLLEKTTIATLARLWGLAGFTTENPGVWVRSGTGPTAPAAAAAAATASTSCPSSARADIEAGGRVGTGPGGDERKIAALGVHLRRHVTGLGVAINYSTPVAGPGETNPWGRIVACGLGDRGVTSVRAELGLGGGADQDVRAGDEEAVNGLAETWASEFQSRLRFHKDAAATMHNTAAKEYDTVLPQIEGVHDSGDDALIEAHLISSLET
jgi:lipoyl(octanoyl) transferase 2